MDRVELQLLQLAFVYHLVNQLIGIDDHIDVRELDFLERTFPRDLMEECNFLDAEGHFTQAFEEARDLALLALPEHLTVGERLALMEVLIDASASDGVLEPEEAQILNTAAVLLHIEAEAWTDHLDRLLEFGTLKTAGQQPD